MKLKLGVSSERNTFGWLEHCVVFLCNLLYLGAEKWCVFVQLVATRPTTCCRSVVFLCNLLHWGVEKWCVFVQLVALGGGEVLYFCATCCIGGRRSVVFLCNLLHWGGEVVYFCATCCNSSQYLLQKSCIFVKLVDTRHSFKQFLKKGLQRMTSINKFHKNT